MFNQANVKNRLRRLVRGRVLVATTSLSVEFVDESLTNSYPLFSVPEIPAGHMLVFSVEVNGYLSFDENSQVKISAETAPYRRLHYDPTAFALVKPADPPAVVPAPVISTALIQQNNATSSGDNLYYPTVVTYSPSGSGTLYMVVPENELYGDDLPGYLESRRLAMIGKTVAQVLPLGFTLQLPA